MRIAALCSGGKDSAYALWLAQRRGHEVVRVVAMIPAREDSWMFHLPNVELMDLFAECTGLPLVKASTSGEPEQELEDLKRVLRGLGVEGVVSGAVASSYQRRRLDRVCEELGLKHLAPLWGKEPEPLLREMLEEGFEVLITSVSAEGLGQEWLGKKLDESSLSRLLELSRRYRFNPVGEGGEYESLVLDAPFFRKRVEVVEAEPVWRGSFGYLLVRRARVVEK